MSVISSGQATLTYPTITTNIIGDNTTNTVTNKTINSASNTLQVNGTNINSLIDQDVRTTASPQFQAVDIYSTGTSFTTLYCSISTPFMDFYNGLSTITLTFPMVSTTLVGDDTSNTFTNKTINSASNTIQVNGTNINSLINQDIRTSATPTLVGLNVGAVATDRTAISTSTVSITNSSGVARLALAGGEATAGASITAASGTLNFNTSNASSPTLRMAIPNTGIANNDTVTSLLGLSGTNLVYRNSTSIPKMIEVRYRHTADQSINNSAAISAKFDTTITSASDITYLAVGGVFIINTPGIYTITATISFAANATGFRDIWLQVGGDSFHWGAVLINNAGGSNLTELTTTISRKFAVNDNFLIGVYQNSGGALNIVGSTSSGDDCSKIVITGILQS